MRQVLVKKLFPFNQAKSEMLPNQGGIDVQFKGMTSAFIQTVKVNGISGLWRGMTATLLKVTQLLFFSPFNLLINVSLFLRIEP